MNLFILEPELRELSLSEIISPCIQFFLFRHRRCRFVYAFVLPSKGVAWSNSKDYELNTTFSVEILLDNPRHRPLNTESNIYLCSIKAEPIVMVTPEYQLGAGIRGMK